MTLVDDYPVAMNCKRCRGTGIVASEWCMHCGGMGFDWLDRSALFTLAHNLAVVGALCDAFWEGWEQREHHDLYSAHGYRTDGDWRPGCGKQAP